jgi:hypothetical protein
MDQEAVVARVAKVETPSSSYKYERTVKLPTLTSANQIVKGGHDAFLVGQI